MNPELLLEIVEITTSLSAISKQHALPSDTPGRIQSIRTKLCLLDWSTLKREEQKIIAIFYQFIVRYYDNKIWKEYDNSKIKVRGAYFTSYPFAHHFLNTQHPFLSTLIDEASKCIAWSFFEKRFLAQLHNRVETYFQEAKKIAKNTLSEVQLPKLLSDEEKSHAVLRNQSAALTEQEILGKSTEHSDSSSDKDDLSSKSTNSSLSSEEASDMINDHLSTPRLYAINKPKTKNLAQALTNIKKVFSNLKPEPNDLQEIKENDDALTSAEKSITNLAQLTKTSSLEKTSLKRRIHHYCTYTFFNSKHRNQAQYALHFARKKHALFKSTGQCEAQHLKEAIYAYEKSKEHYQQLGQERELLKINTQYKKAKLELNELDKAQAQSTESQFCVIS